MLKLMEEVTDGQAWVIVGQAVLPDDSVGALVAAKKQNLAAGRG